MPLQRFPLSDYRGGLNLRDNALELQANETQDALNVTLTTLVGELTVRAGKTALSATGFPGGRIDNIVSFNIGGITPGIMASINGKIYTLQGLSAAWTLRFTGTAGTVWDFAQMQDATGADWVWCSNGVDQAQKWAGGATTAVWAGPVGAGGKRILVWRNKMISCQNISQPGYRIFLSPVGDPEGTTGGYDNVELRGPGDEGALVTDMNVLADRLYIFKQKSVWSLTDATSGANRRVGEPGCTGRFQSGVCNNKLYFLNEQGIWSTQGVSVELESGQLGNFFPSGLVGSTAQAQVNIGQIGLARLMTTRDQYSRVLVCLPMGADAFNSRVLELIPNMNFRRIGGRRYILLPAFMLHDFHASALGTLPTVSNFHALVGGDDSGANKAYQYFDPQATTDDGAFIAAHWQSSWVGIQEQEPKERLRRLNVQLSGDVHVDVYKDFGTAPSFSKDIRSNSTWGSGTWAGSVWGPVGYTFQRVRPETRGRFHSVRLSSIVGGLPFVITSMELAVRGGKEH